MSTLSKIAAGFSALVISVSTLAQPALTGGGRPSGMGGYGMQRGQWNPQTKGLLTGTVTLSPDNPEGEEMPGTGTVVMVVTSKKDTLHTTVSESGRFRIFNIPTGKAYVSFILMGYRTESHSMNIAPGENKAVAYLKPDPMEIEGAMLKETVDPVSVNKDTIIFNAAAVKVNKGEMAIDILEQMPGVEVSESSVTVLNEEIKNVYIDGALLFGEAPMKALNNLPAEEVLTIKSYQEYANKDPFHKISKNESKERVLDVSTKSKPKFISRGDLIAGGGFDTDTTYHKFRYTSGVSVGAFSEKLQMHADFNINNINDSGNRRRGNSFRTASGGGSADLRDISAAVGVNRKWMSPTTRNFVLGSIGGNYSYSDNYQVNESITQLLYFPNEQYQSRREDKTSYSEATGKSHNFSLNARKSLHDGQVRLNGSYNLNDNTGSSATRDFNTQDALAPQGTSAHRTSDSQGKSYSGSFNFNKRFRDKLGISLNASASGSDNENASLRTDTTTSTISRQVLDISGLGHSSSWNISPNMSWEIDDKRTISANYKYSNNYSTSEQFAYDVTDETLRILDPVNSHTRIVDNNTHSAELTYRSFIEGPDAILSAGIGYISTGMNRHETFPAEELYDKRFNSFRPAINIGTESMINRWNISWSSSCSTPSLDQVRPRIDNSNLYNVSAGNPDLVQSRRHDIAAGYSTVLGAAMRETVREMEENGQINNPRNVKDLSTLSININASVNKNPIVNKRIYYSEETYLPGYGYTMPAQSTFSTYENASDSYSAGASARFGVPLQKIMWMFNSSLSLNWDSSPSYVNYTLTRTRNLRPSLRVGMRSNFSRNVRINISGTASYIHSENDLQDNTDYFTERINAGWELNNILKHLYAGGNYTKTFTQGLEYARINDNIFNLKAGWKGGPRNNVDISISVHDLFNRTTGFSTSMNANYISNKWTHNFGRYVMFTLAYRFNSMKGDSRIF